MKRAIVCVLVLMFCLPLSVLSEADDFLADSERYESTNALYNSVRYSELGLVVDEYIKEKSPQPSDSAFAIKAILDESADAINAIEEVIDDFDGSRSFTLDGIHEISEDCCLVPGYNPSDWLHVNLGFIADDWVFFDRIAISADSEVVWEYDFENSDKVTDVLEGGSVLERVRLPVDCIEFDAAQAICDSSKAIIRFSNTSTDAKYDHVLSDGEKSALIHCWTLLKTRTALSEFCWAYAHSD